MSDEDSKVPLPDLENAAAMRAVDDAGSLAPSDSDPMTRGAADLEAVFDVPVQVSAADLEKLFDARVYLEVWVKVRSGWTEDEGMVARLGYD